MKLVQFREISFNNLVLGAAVMIMTIMTSLIIPSPSHAVDCASGGPCAIGDIGPGGGIVFLAPTSAGNSTGQFFEAAPNTWNGSAPDATAQWCLASDASIAGLGRAIGTGVTNSATIDTNCVSTGPGNAAKFVRAATIGGLTDWFLPSIDEMLALYNQNSLLTGSYATNQANIDAARYLTSSQGTNPLNAGGVYMQGSGFPGTSSDFSKSSGFAVRPMRMFTATERSSESGTSTESAVTFELTFSDAFGVSCVRNSSSTAGSWLALPAADDCSSPLGISNARFLGWATNPDFPVAIAQRQVDNGWGAYEIFDANGQLAAVFIPAGGATQLTSPGALYAIWKN